MKHIDELTEQEILALTEDEIDYLINVRIAEEGIKFVPYPNSPILSVIPKPTICVYTCNLFGDDLVFTDIEELQKVLQLLESCKSKCSIDSDYSLPEESRYRISNKLRTRYSSYGNSPWDSINTIKVYTDEEYSRIRDIAMANNKLQAEYKSDLREYKDTMEKSKDIRSEIYDVVNKVVNKYNTYNTYINLLVNTYLPIAKGDLEIAINFLDKAYNLTPDQKTYVLEHYNDSINHE